MKSNCSPFTDNQETKLLSEMSAEGAQQMEYEEAQPPSGSATMASKEKKRFEVLFFSHFCPPSMQLATLFFFGPVLHVTP